MSNPIQFGPPEFCAPILVSPKDIIVKPVADDSGVDVLFNKFTLALDGNSQELSAVYIATLRLPAALPDDKGLVGYVGDLFGFVAKDAQSRAVLLADLGGTVKVIEFPYGEERNGNFKQGLFCLERRNAKQNETDALPLPPYVMTIMLSIQRLTTKSSVQITLDSLDFAVVSSR